MNDDRTRGTGCRVIVIGATGTIGRAVADALSAGHEVVRVGHSGGEHTADIEDAASLEALFAAVAPFDAVVCCAGQASFKPLARARRGRLSRGPRRTSSSAR